MFRWPTGVIQLMARAICVVVAVAAGLVVTAPPAAAQEVFHVAPDGNDDASGTVSHPWATIAKANATLRAGDTVVIHAGTYDDQIRPARSGTSHNNRITYRVAGDGEVVLTEFPSPGTDDDGAIALAGRQYVTVSGEAFGQRQLILRPTSGIFNVYGSVCGSEGVIVEYVEMTPPAGAVPGRGFDFCLNFEPGSRETRFNILRHNLIVGVSSPSHDPRLFTEDLVTLAQDAHHNLIEHNELHLVRHSVLYADSPISHSNVIRNNVITNAEHTALSIWSAGVALADGARFLVEGNRLVGSGDTLDPDGGPGSAFQWGADELIIRHNVIARGGAASAANQHSTVGGLTGATGYSYGAAYAATDGRVYANTIVGNRGPAVAVMGFEGGVDLGRHRFINNVIFGAGAAAAPEQLVTYWDSGWSTNDRWVANVFGRPAGAVSDRIIMTDAGSMALSTALSTLRNPLRPEFTASAGFVNRYSAAPGFTDYAGGDYTPAPGSVLIDAGAPITMVAATDVGVGTSLVVEDARPFFAEAGEFPYWMGVRFESILVGDSPTTATEIAIVGVDDDSGVLRLGQSVNRSAGTSVWLARDSSGQSRIGGVRPDIGAIEGTGPGGPPPGQGADSGVVINGIRCYPE